MQIRKYGGWRDITFVLLVTIVTVIVLLLPAGDFYKRPDTEREAWGKVVEVNNDMVFQRGIFRQGEQQLVVELLAGEHKSEQITVMNLLQGNLELEWFYQQGEKVLTGYSVSDGQIIAGRALEPYRQGPELWLLVLFFAMVLIFAGWTGVKAFISFAFTVTIMWKILLPYYIKGTIDPVLVSLAVVTILCFVTIFIVAGFNKKGTSAFLGSLAGALATWGVLMLFGGFLKINGTTANFSTALAFSGFEQLNLLRLFFAAAILSATGAIMDVAMDIAAAMCEIVEKRPDIGHLELIRSGFSIGRMVIGTMTTTLLLAYSGNALTMLMYLMTRGIPLFRIINMNHVASEALKTLAGTMGLTLVAPLTAIIAAFILVPVAKNASHTQPQTHV